MKQNAFLNWLDRDWKKNGTWFLLLALNAILAFLLFLGGCVQRNYDRGFRRIAAKNETFIHTYIIPDLTRKHNLGSCLEKSFGWGEINHFRLETAGPQSYEAITRDLVRLYQEHGDEGRYRNTNSVEYVNYADGRPSEVHYGYLDGKSFLFQDFYLEFDHDSEDLGLTARIFIKRPKDRRETDTHRDTSPSNGDPSPRYAMLEQKDAS